MAYTRTEDASGKGQANFDAADRQKYVQQALAGGASQGSIDSFLQLNPGDYQRLGTALGSGGGSSAPASTPATDALAGAGGGAASEGVGLTALSGLATGGSSTAAAGASPASPASTDIPQFVPPEPGGALRGQLGNRVYPQESMVLAGLKRAY